MPPSTPSSPAENATNPMGSSHGSIFGNDSQTSPLDLSRTSIHFPPSHQTVSIERSTSSSSDLSVKDSDNHSRQMSVDCSYNQPEILTPPKAEWHYRNKRDLAKGHIPFLSGDGPQRTPIRVMIPEASDRPIYLAIAVVTHDEQFHDSKVIVPPKTKVSGNCPPHDNNLNCLQFNECNPTDRFDLATRNVYLQVSPEEHNAKLKEVRVHMFNLYQNQIITKEIIEAKQLQLCRLAFWFCIYDNKHYIPISERSISSIIREKKNNTRSSVLQQITTENNITSVSPYSMVNAEYYNQYDGDDADYISDSSMNE